MKRIIGQVKVSWGDGVNRLFSYQEGDEVMVTEVAMEYTDFYTPYRFYTLYTEYMPEKGDTCLVSCDRGTGFLFVCSRRGTSPEQYVIHLPGSRGVIATAVKV
jgi:hypothetical protein